MQLEKEREVVENVRRRYAPKNDRASKLERLAKLDAKVRRPAEIFAYAFGIMGALVLGLGMCLAMKVLGDLMPLGIAVGCAGIAMVSLTYFLYGAILRFRKKKYAQQVLRLSDELLNNENR